MPSSSAGYLARMEHCVLLRVGHPREDNCSLVQGNLSMDQGQSHAVPEDMRIHSFADSPWVAHAYRAVEGSIPASTPLATCFVRSTNVVRTLISLGSTEVKKPKRV